MDSTMIDFACGAYVCTAIWGLTFAVLLWWAPSVRIVRGGEPCEPPKAWTVRR